MKCTKFESKAVKNPLGFLREQSLGIRIDLFLNGLAYSSAQPLEREMKNLDKFLISIYSDLNEQCLGNFLLEN